MRIAIFDRLTSWLDDRLRGHEAERGRWGRLFLRTTRLIVLVERRFRADMCLERAASLAFSSVIASIPATMIALLAIQLVRGIESEVAVLDPYISLLAEYVPETNRQEFQAALLNIAENLRIEQHLSNVLAEISSQAGPVTAVSILVLVLSAMTVFRSAERAFTGIWRVDRRRGIFEKVATFWLLLTAAPAILGVSAYVKAQLVRGLIGGEAGASSAFGKFLSAVFIDGLFPLSISFFAFLLLSTYLPNTRVRLAAAAGGALTSAIGWELGTRAFQLYVESTMLSGLLGALGVVPFFLLWVYFSWGIVLVGAETSYCLQHYPTLVSEAWGRKKERTIARPTLALLILERVYLAFRREQDSLDAPDDLSRRLGVTIGEVEEVVSVLVAAELLVPHNDGWLPGRSADRLDPASVIALFPTRAGFQVPSELEGQESPLLTLLSQVDAAVSSQLENQTFADLLPPPQATQAPSEA